MDPSGRGVPLIEAYFSYEAFGPACAEGKSERLISAEAKPVCYTGPFALFRLGDEGLFIAER